MKLTHPEFKGLTVVTPDDAVYYAFLLGAICAAGLFFLMVQARGDEP